MISDVVYILFRFGLTEGRPHSCGGVYLSINDIVRGEHFLQRHIHLATTIPGPKEPSLLQLNHCLEPLMNEMQQIYAGLWSCICSNVLTTGPILGVMMKVYDATIPPVVGGQSISSTHHKINGNLTMINTNLPASWKATGSAAVTHKTQMCDKCDMTYVELNMDRAYNISGRAYLIVSLPFLTMGLRSRVQVS